MSSSSTLIAALSEALDRPLSWTDLLILRNFGDPSRAHSPDGALEARGFHAMVFTKGGRATHYIKCRSPLDLRAGHEARLLTGFRDVPAAAVLVPRAAAVDVAGLAVLVLEIVEGQSYSHIVARASLVRALESAEGCLMARQTLVAAAGALGMWGPSPTHRFSPRTSLEPSLGILARTGIAPEVLDGIRDAMPEQMPAARQHGDFTPGNIIWSRSGPVILDFEAFGEVICPLYDTWHFIRNSREERGEGTAWLGVAAPVGPADTGWRALLESEAALTNLPAEQIAASLLWYLAHFSALIITQGIKAEYCTPYLEDLGRAVDLVNRLRRTSR